MFLALLVHTAPVEGVGAMSSRGAPPISGCGVGPGEGEMGAERWTQEAGDNDHSFKPIYAPGTAHKI